MQTYIFSTNNNYDENGGNFEMKMGATLRRKRGQLHDGIGGNFIRKPA